MSPVAFKTLCAAACAVHTAFFGVWALFFILSGMPGIAITLGTAAFFCGLACAVQIHDRKIEKAKAGWRGPQSSAPYLYENLTSPAGTGTTDATRDAG